MRSIERRLVLGSALTVGFIGLPSVQHIALAQASNGSAEQRMRDRGIELSKFVPMPGINNVPYVRTGNLVFVSGLGPRNPDGTIPKGKVGKDVTVEQAYQQARSAGMLVLSVLRDGIVSLDNVTRVVKVFGMVNAAPDFLDPPIVVNGCSDLFVEVFGDERGRHARTAIGVASLPFGLTVEIDSVFEVT
jgi:enamine deaminase RidA (YjgF/YER057c/UK114 family)